MRTGGKNFGYCTDLEKFVKGEREDNGRLLWRRVRPHGLPCLAPQLAPDFVRTELPTMFAIASGDRTPANRRKTQAVPPSSLEKAMQTCPLCKKEVKSMQIKRARLPFGKRAPLLDLAMFPLPLSKMTSSYQASTKEGLGK